jgi:hypothetical protein
MKEEISRRTLIVAIATCATLLVTVPSTAMYFLQHHESLQASAETADQEFLKLRARFAGQHPLLDMAARQAVEPDRNEPANRRPAAIHSFHTVIFDTRGRHRLVRLSASCAFARLFAHRDGLFRWLGELTFLDDTEFDPEPIQLSFEAIKRHGPGLIVDYRHPGGGQFIAWVE